MLRFDHVGVVFDDLDAAISFFLDLGFEQEGSGGIKNFLVSANSSAAKESRILFKFDGKVYRQSQCYEGPIRSCGGED